MAIIGSNTSWSIFVLCMSNAAIERPPERDSAEGTRRRSFLAVLLQLPGYAETFFFCHIFADIQDENAIGNALAKIVIIAINNQPLKPALPS